MTTMECPKDCQERHNSNKSATYLALSGVAALFIFFGGLYLYSNSTYAATNDLIGVKEDFKSELRALRADIKELNNKVDTLLLRSKEK